MIFYFSGTGNSFAAAQTLQQGLGGDLINITDCMQHGRYKFSISEDEPVGIVAPVYYGGLPSIVNTFLERVKFSVPPVYLYGVLTYGGFVFGAGGKMARKLKHAGLTASAVFTVKMPANYAMLYEPPHEEEAKRILEKSEERLGRILVRIRNQEIVKEGAQIPGTVLSAISYPLYEKDRKTAPFYVDDRCISCGVCVGRCPVKAIAMVDGTHTWVKSKCVFCMSCLRCNAIQYGDKLKDRYRYRHPIYQKKH